MILTTFGARGKWVYVGGVFDLLGALSGAPEFTDEQLDLPGCG